MPFREPISHPHWDKRARRLATLMGTRTFKASELLWYAHQEIGWSLEQARAVLAAGEGTRLIERKGVWRALGAVPQAGENSPGPGSRRITHRSGKAAEAGGVREIPGVGADPPTTGACPVGATQETGS